MTLVQSGQAVLCQWPQECTQGNLYEQLGVQGPACRLVHEDDQMLDLPGQTCSQSMPSCKHANCGHSILCNL